MSLAIAALLTFLERKLMSVMSEYVAEKIENLVTFFIFKKPLLLSLFIMDMQEITGMGNTILVNHCETSFLERQ